MTDQVVTPLVVEPSIVAAPAPTTPPVVEPPATNHLTDLLGTITRPDGTQKFATVDTALQAIPAQDAHIQSLETELATLRAAANKETTMEEVLSAVKANITPETPAASTGEPGPSGDDIARYVQDAIVQRDEEKIAEQNAAVVAATLDNHFGSREKAEEAYLAVAASNGLSIEFLHGIARKSPEAVFSMMGLDLAQPSHEAPLKSEVLPGSLSNQIANPSEPKPVMGMVNSKELKENWQHARKLAIAKIQKDNEEAAKLNP